MALNADQITAQNFKDFYGQIRPYLNGTAHGGFTPIGTVISVMGKQAPHNYLVCDGTVYNIADYPELAAYFTGQFEASNFFGGNGTTTFAVPDLRGEFLRGTGTNSHTNQGNGSDVGVHQDGSLLYSVVGTGNGVRAPQAQQNSTFDKQQGSGKCWINTTKSDAGDGSIRWGTTRPTNTSVLYCIATKNIFMDAGCNYSTDEQVVGTWVDGKPVYQRTYISDTSFNRKTNVVIDTIANVGDVTNCFGYVINVLDDNRLFIGYSGGVNLSMLSTGALRIYSDGWDCKGYRVTVQYTKTTD